VFIVSGELSCVCVFIVSGELSWVCVFIVSRNRNILCMCDYCTQDSSPDTINTHTQDISIS
jgi:hypothetical protein